MSIIKATATVTYEFDTDDGLVATEEDAADQVRSMIETGQVSGWEIDVNTVREPRIEHVIISFDTTGAAFTEPLNHEPDDYFLMLETTTILSTLIWKMTERGEIGSLHDRPILDSNGNTVGVVTITRSKP